MNINLDTVQQQSAKIFEQKKKLEDVIAKYEQRREQLLQLQKISYSIPATSNLALIVSTQLGLLKATLVSKVNTEVNKALQRFINTCPPPIILSRISKIKDNLIKSSNSYQRSIQTFSKIAAGLNASILLVKGFLKLRYIDPKPTAVGGVGVPMGFVNLSSDAIYKLNKKLDDYSEQVNTLTAVIAVAQNISSPIQEKLNVLDSYIERCTLQDVNNANNIYNSITSQEMPKSTANNPDSNFYKGYTLSIVLDRDTSTIAPKRYAIAQDNQGVVVLRGPSSFSSDTQVLLDELKFRIDNQLS